MGFASLQEIINFAIEKEQEAAEFYEQASNEASMSGAKQMLKEFSKEEQKHKQMLQNLDAKVIANYQPSKITDLKRSDYIADMEYKKGMGYREILMVAMKREEKAKKLYDELEQRSDAQDFKKIFKMLSEEESKHKLALETMYDDHMAKMGD